MGIHSFKCRSYDLCLWRILRSDKVPANIQARQAQWVDLREPFRIADFIKLDGNSQSLGFTNDQFSHPLVAAAGRCAV